jgi:hypothetical protein
MESKMASVLLTFLQFVCGRVNNATLGTLDFSTLRNGAYDIELRVRDGSDMIIESRRIMLDSELKIGHFSFSEQDLVIPVNGIPLTVVRTYNSLNPDSGALSCTFSTALNHPRPHLKENIAGGTYSCFLCARDRAPILTCARILARYRIRSRCAARARKCLHRSAIRLAGLRAGGG